MFCSRECFVGREHFVVGNVLLQGMFCRRECFVVGMFCDGNVLFRECFVGERFVGERFVPGMFRGGMFCRTSFSTTL